MPAEFRPCVLVPCFDHADTIGAVVDALRAELPVIVVDDGSGAACARAIDQAVAQASGQGHPVHCVRLEENRGKGMAVIAGLRAAAEQGFSHALQVDADAQHDLGAVPRFVKLARNRPGALVLGVPEYDDNAPRSRVYGRYLTHVWVWINTPGFAIGDSMCGFRVYPVQPVLHVLDQARYAIAPRMGFDIEICLWCAWAGMGIVNAPVAVRYPVNGRSHFRLWHDNLEITRMHARCFFGMLARLPGRVLRRAGRGARG